MKYAVWLSGLVTYAEAATILNTIGEIPISVSSIWRLVAVWGPKCQALETAWRHRAAPRSGLLSRELSPHAISRNA